MSESKRTGEVVHGPVGNGPQQGMNCISHGQPTPLLSSNQNAAASTSTAGASTPAAAASAPNADNNTQTVAVRGTSSAAAALASTHYEAARATAQQPVRQHATPATPAATPPQPHAAIPASSSLQPQHVAPLHLRYTMPIHILQPPAGPGGYPMIGTRPSETPEVFRHRKLRSGKWTSEEESYADILIELFEKGHIDEKNGCTLRSFLSKKLHCAPMRISKKYAGKGIGKMVYLSKTNITGVDGVGSAVYNANMTRLREAEVNFLKIVYPEMAPVGFIYHTSFFLISKLVNRKDPYVYCLASLLFNPLPTVSALPSSSVTVCATLFSSTECTGKRTLLILILLLDNGQFSFSFLSRRLSLLSLTCSRITTKTFR